jgi:hypothetical protein
MRCSGCREYICIYNPAIRFFKICNLGLHLIADAEQEKILRYLKKKFETHYLNGL